jgi:hypothetical protein
VGIVSLKNEGERWHEGRQVQLYVPNESVRRQFGELFLTLVSGSPGSAAKFLSQPSAPALDQLLCRNQDALPWTTAQTESDLQSVIFAALLQSPPWGPTSEHASPVGNYSRTDITVSTKEHFIIIEFKTVRAGRDSSSLTERASTKLGFEQVPNEEARPYPRSALENLARLTPKQFRDLRVSCRIDGLAVKTKTVGSLHKAAEKHAAMCAAAAAPSAATVKRAAAKAKAKASSAAGRANVHGGKAAPGLRVVAFAVTQVVNRFLVTQVV